MGLISDGRGVLVRTESKDWVGSENSLRSSTTARRGIAVRGPCCVAWLRSFAVVVLRQTAELLFALCRANSFCVAVAITPQFSWSHSRVVADAEHRAKSK